MESLLVVALLFITLGILIKYGKMHQLMAGYNTLSEEQKKNYDIEGIATVFRNAMFIMSLIIFAGYLLGLWLENERISLYALFVAIATGIPYLLLRSNSKKFRINNQKPPNQLNSSRHDT